MKTEIISLVNPKGGAGKTVSAVNIAYALVNKGYKTLLIDSDPRSAIQVYLNIENDKTLYNLLENKYIDYTTKINVKDYAVNKKSWNRNSGPAIFLHKRTLGKNSQRS